MFSGVRIAKNGLSNFYWKNVFLSNAPTRAVWLHETVFDVPGCTVNEIAMRSVREESWTRCHRALYAHCCALDDECAARISSARSRRYAALLVALSYARFVVSYPFCSRGFVGDKLARRTGHRFSSQRYGWRTRTAGLQPTKELRFPSMRRHLPHCHLRSSQLPSASSQHLARPP